VSSVAAVTYEIDESDRLIEVNEAWTAFAMANSAPAMIPPQILGQLIWEEFSDPTTIQLYRVMVERVRERGQSVCFDFRCDAPAVRRWLMMRIEPASNHRVRFEILPRVIEPRPPVALLDAAALRSDDLLTMCGWCKKIRSTDGTWVEVETAIQTMRLFEQGRLPHISHGVCRPCYENIRATIDSMEQPQFPTPEQAVVDST
jgi:hypothetical protein